ncbi:hypothetical protein Cni_G06154 [Canna indica]|uniref:RIN4 pathogenic type III effector avirulence factor Avr cleavage site domain-containing protein n=1 Tax=Canna indica TaxID=4628 RepID=A0AAQ3JWQ4_9LILI|nr:hypothetical protein Cni_G06154 [Canna indica]
MSTTSPPQQATLSEAVKLPEAPGLKGTKPVRKEGFILQTATDHVYSEDKAWQSTKDSASLRHKNERRRSVRGANPSLQEKGVAPEGAPRKRRTKPRNKSCEMPENDVIVPPFNDWEKNPESADKYTGVFQLIGESRKTPGTPTTFVIEPDSKKDDTGCKGCRCLSWLFK